MFDTIRLLFNEFTGGITSVLNWKPKEFILFNPMMGFIVVLCKLLGIALGISFIIFLATYSSYIVVSKTYTLLF